MAGLRCKASASPIGLLGLCYMEELMALGLADILNRLNSLLSTRRRHLGLQFLQLERL